MIYECGITELTGRQHRYRHTRLPDAWVVDLQIRGGTRRTSSGCEAHFQSPGLGCSRPGVIYDIASLPPHRNSSIYAVIRQPASWEPVGLPEVQPGYFWVALAGHPFLPDIVETFRAMYRWTRTFVPNAEPLAMNAFDRAMLLTNATVAGSIDRRDDRLHGITGFIFEHMDEPLNVAFLATHVGLSESRFSHLFTGAFGITPMAYVERVRMEEAKALLAGGTAPVYAIARRVGYESEFYFSRRFKKHTGVAPSVYRARKTHC